MTCVIGLKHQDKIYMCTDTAITIGGGLLAGVGSKMLKSDQCLVGLSGPRSVFNVLSNREYLFAGSFNAAHLNGIWECLRDITPINCESELLIAANSQLFWIGNIAGWRVVTENFECIGSGCQVAKGAMAISENLINDPLERLLDTMEIVEKYCIGIKGPFDTHYILKEECDKNALI